MMEIRVFYDKDAWLDGITDDFIQSMAGIPVSRQPRLCLAGGQTPEPAYRAFSRLLIDGKIGLAPVILVPGDERVSLGRPVDLNETMLGRSFAPAIESGAATLYSWFDEVTKKMVADFGTVSGPDMSTDHLPGTNRLPDTDFDSGSVLARSMIKTMEALLALLASPDQPLFDLCYLGMGADGHTAGLFPGMPGLDDPGFCVRGLAPQPPRQRVSLGLPALTSSGRTRFLLGAAGKEAALEKLRKGDPSCPVVRAATADAIAFVLA